MTVANDLKDLPHTAQALAEEMPKLARRLQRAGTRLGDAPRTEADIMGLFDKIPGTFDMLPSLKAWGFSGYRERHSCSP